MAPHSSTLAWENPMDAGARWAAVCGVAHSRTRLKRLSSSSSSRRALAIETSCGHVWGFAGGSDGKESTCYAEDLGSIPGSGKSPGEGNSYPLQYSCLESPMDRGLAGYSPSCLQ